MKRLLGVYMDRTLAFTAHVDFVSEKIGKRCRMIGAVANTEWGWMKDTLTKLYNCQIKTIMHYGAPAWRPWISDTNVATLERMDQRALRMITGQSVGSPCEAIRLESGVTSFGTVRKRNILTAKERALRCTEDHPAQIAVSNDGIRQRIKIRKGFRHTADQLSEYLPPQSINRRPINLTVPPPWEKHGALQVTVADASTKKAATDDNLLRESTLEEIRREEADYILYSDGSAVGGTLDGGSAVVITKGHPEDPEVLEIRRTKGSPITCSTEEETAAMESAKNWIQEKAQPGTKILICTDSNALCQALVNPQVGEFAILKKELERMPVNIHVKWVPAHVNMPGNELADKEAKEARNIDEEPRPISYQTIKQLIRRNIKDPPTQHEQTRHVYEHYKLGNDEAITNRADQTLIAKIRTGHWKQFREFKSRVDGGKTDPYC